jgi:hypothetical protein
MQRTPGVPSSVPSSDRILMAWSMPCHLTSTLTNGCWWTSIVQLCGELSLSSRILYPGQPGVVQHVATIYALLPQADLPPKPVQYYISNLGKSISYNRFAKQWKLVETSTGTIEIRFYETLPYSHHFYDHVIGKRYVTWSSQSACIPEPAFHGFQGLPDRD